LSGLRAEAYVGAGDGKDEIDQHAAVQGKFLNRFRLDDFADTRIRGAEDVGCGIHINSLFHSADLQGNLESQFLSDFDMQDLLDRREA